MQKTAIFACAAALVLTACSRPSTDIGSGAGQPNAPAPSCQVALVRTDVLELQGVKIEVSDYTVSDMPAQSWVSASFTLQDHKLRLTNAAAKDLLQQLFGRIAESCRKNPLQKTRIFLYPRGVTAGESANWIASYDSTSNPATTIHDNLLKDERKDRYACVDQQEPGRSLAHDPKLPPLNERKIIGTWADPTFNLTLSLEQVGAKTYRVFRSAYCTSGERGELLKSGLGNRYSVIGSSAGDYYEVQPGGELGVFDRDGRVDTLPIHFALHPAPVAGR